MKYEYIGWCKKDNHDKVWGILRLDRNKCLTFWGAEVLNYKQKWL